MEEKVMEKYEPYYVKIIEMKKNISLSMYTIKA